ncbi:exosome component 10-like [Teleopsis dalmanni]|uniref:exosome component 10-like n=1 Tax=Teleopsis dalmanni TaxID=139649 RepID=UPI0018CC8157|nr:exosome component 10-like [Teleopsis dalmanni]
MDNQNETITEEPAAKKAKLQEKASSSGLENLLKTGFQQVVKAVKLSNGIPSEEERSYYSTYKSFNDNVSAQSDMVLNLMSHILKYESVGLSLQKRTDDEKFDLLQQCNDAALERVNSNLDIYAGAVQKDIHPIIIESEVKKIDITTKNAGSWNLKQAKETTDKETIAARLITAKNIARPQIKFNIPIDNSNNTPFIPKLTYKPNSLKPLAILPEYDEAGDVVSYLHPYEFELEKFEMPEEELQQKSPVKPAKVDVVELMHVDTVELLNKALEELRQHKMIAVDVEHHAYRSFLGFTCLVQMSTKDKDYIFDALKLRDDMHILNEVLTNPKIVKIFHGADLDIIWLQRDLSLYVVNMFDTHHAAKLLNFSRLSLAYLLKHYCDIEVDKTFQLADWRIRPLPDMLINYARQDTHYLIYVYESICNDLLDKSNQHGNLLRNVYQTSNELCKRRYCKPLFNNDSHLEFYRKSKHIFDNRQMSALSEIFAWRDAIARKEDESYNYVLPNHMLLRISETLPREAQGILACCNPIPPLVRQNLYVLHDIILKARAKPLIKPTLVGDAFSRVATKGSKDYDNILYCPHDLTVVEDFRDDLPTMLKIDKNNVDVNEIDEIAEKITYLQLPTVDVFEKMNAIYDDPLKKAIKEGCNKSKFKTPYERYLAILPQIEKEKLEEAERIAHENRSRQLCPSAPKVVVKEEINTENDDTLNVSIKEYLKRKRVESDGPSTSSKVAKMQSTSTLDQKDKPSSSKASLKKKNSTSHKTDKPPIISKDESRLNESIVTIEDESDTDVIVSTDVDTNKSNTNDNKNNFSSKVKNKFNNFKKKFKNKRKNKAQKSGQSSNVPVQNNFDYNNVDFKKFQGGSQRANGIQMKQTIHGKSNSNKAKNKKFNKLFTFSNVKSKK